MGGMGLVAPRHVGGIFPDQGLNPCLLHWQVDSLPLSHQESEAPLLLLFCLSLSSQAEEQGKGPAGCARGGREWRVVSEETRTHYLLNRGDRYPLNASIPWDLSETLQHRTGISHPVVSCVILL